MNCLHKPIAQIPIMKPSFPPFAVMIIKKHAPHAIEDHFNVPMVFRRTNKNWNPPIAISNKTINQFTYFLNYYLKNVHHVMHQTIVNNQSALNELASVPSIGKQMKINSWEWYFNTNEWKYGGLVLRSLFNHSYVKNRFRQMISNSFEEEKTRQRQSVSLVLKDIGKLRKKQNLLWEDHNVNPQVKKKRQMITIKRVLEEVSEERERMFEQNAFRMYHRQKTLLCRTFEEVNEKHLLNRNQALFTWSIVQLEHKKALVDPRPPYTNQDGKTVLGKVEEYKRVQTKVEESSSIIREQQNNIKNIMEALSHQEKQMKQITIQQEKIRKETHNNPNLKQVKEEFMRDFKETLWLEKMRRGLD